MLIYKYQILYLDCITIVLWGYLTRGYLVNDRLVSQPIIAQKCIKTPILAFKVIQNH